MDACIECTHCRVVMTSWSAPGSSIRYYQCPFCQRTHSSLYGEVFRRRAGARVVDARPRAAAAATGIPMASPEDVRWARVKATAARWFARLQEDQRSCAERDGYADEAEAEADACAEPEAPYADPADVVEVAGARARRRS
jgi:hypothetical protein